MSDFKGISEQVMQRLRKRADKQGVSVNTLLEQILNSETELTPTPSTLREANYQTFMDHLPSWVFAHLPGGQVIYANHAMATSLGRSTAEIIGANVFEEVSEDIGNPIQDRLAKLTPENPIVTHEIRSDARPDIPRWERWNDRAFFDDQGRVLFYLSIGQDITERKQAIDQLEQSERQLSTLLDNLPGMAYRCRNNRNWTMEFVSSGCQALTGYSPEALLNDNEISYSSLILDEQQAMVVWQTVQNAIAEGKSYELEYRIRAADGTIKTVWERGMALHRPNGEVILEGFVSDVTQRKQLEINLRESQALYESLVQNLPMRIYRINRDGFIEFINRTAVESVDMTPEEVVGKLSYDFHPDELAQQYRTDDNYVMETGETLRRTEPHVLANTGELRHVEVIKSPVYDSDGNINGLQCAYWDITDLKTLEEDLRASQALYESLVENLPINVYRVDNEGRLVFANSTFLHNLGAGKLEDVKGVHATDLYPSDLAEKYREDDRRVVELGETLHLTERNIAPSTGEVSYVEVLKTPIYDEEGKIQGIQGIFWDVTVRKILEKTLRESEARYRSLVEDLPVMLCSWLPDGEITFINQAYKRTFSKQDQDASPGNFFEKLPTAERASVRVAVTNLSPEHPIYTAEHQMVNATGQARWYRWTDRALFDAEGNVTGYRSIGEDITEQKRIQELARQMERLKTRVQQENENNALIQRIISALSHDLRTPLTVVQSAKDLLEMYYDRLPDQRRRELLDNIGRQVQFANNLLEDTVHMAHGTLSEQSFKPVLTNLELLCRVSMEETSTAQKGNHTFKFVNKTSLQSLLLDEVLISRILLNLLSNAAKYSPEGSEIRLELVQNGTWIEIRVIDQGYGIPSDDLPHIFDPFFRSSEVHDINGTGLGLSIVKDCVVRHQGNINVESVVGKGSTFIVKLPLFEAAVG